MRHGKKEKEEKGFLERMALLESKLNNADKIIASARETYPSKKDLADDDILDALVGAVTASHYQDLATLPEIPDRDAFGSRMEMVYSTRYKKTTL